MEVRTVTWQLVQQSVHQPCLPVESSFTASWPYNMLGSPLPFRTDLKFLQGLSEHLLKGKFYYKLLLKRRKNKKEENWGWLWSGSVRSNQMCWAVISRDFQDFRSMLVDIASTSHSWWWWSVMAAWIPGCLSANGRTPQQNSIITTTETNKRKNPGKQRKKEKKLSVKNNKKNLNSFTIEDYITITHITLNQSLIISLLILSIYSHIFQET